MISLIAAIIRTVQRCQYQQGQQPADLEYAIDGFFKAVLQHSLTRAAAQR
jgi:hypothetical protein